jgi:glycerophosphoryl diester phosphodiesterase
MIFGHRGLGTDKHNPPLPENTIDSLVKAATLPFVSGVEFDVQMLADGNLVVYHDFDFKNKQLAELTLPDVGEFLPACEFKSLLSTLALTQKRVICELKYPPLNSKVWRTNRSRAEMADAVVDALINSGIKDIYVSSFDPNILVEVKKIL